MTIYSFWIFDRHCNCVFSREWTAKSSSGGSKLFGFAGGNTSSNTSTNNATAGDNPQQPNQTINGTINGNNYNDNAKLLFGAIFSLRNVAAKLYSVKPLDSSSDEVAPNAIGNYLKTFSTNNYRVHYFETATNWKFALITDPSIEDLSEVLKTVYTNYFNEFVIKNALSAVDFQEGEFISNTSFVSSIDKYLMSLPAFS